MSTKIFMFAFLSIEVALSSSDMRDQRDVYNFKELEEPKGECNIPEHVQPEIKADMQFAAFLLLLSSTSLFATTTNVSITFPEASYLENSVAAEPAGSFLKEMTHHVANLGLKSVRDLLSGHSNVVISPLNMYSCLGILDLGAAGETKTEIRRVLGPSDENFCVSTIVKSGDEVSYASAVFLDYGFVPETDFVDAATGKFQASVLNVNMSNGEEAKDSINSWVSDHTNGTIVDLLQGRLDVETKMVVVSALLFKGRWLHSFPKAATASGKFETEDSSVDVSLMHLLASISLLRNPHFDAISLPYSDGRGMKMHVILPRAHGVPALKKLLSQLSPDFLRKLQEESSNEEVFIVMPKFKIEGRFSLTDSLKKQGICSMFEPATANFTAVAKSSTGLFVSQIYHSVHFEMDEEGTVASAATASILTKSSRFIFHVNRPFIFAVTDQSDIILFMGVIVNPLL